MQLVIGEVEAKVEGGTHLRTIHLEVHPSTTTRATLRAMFPVGGSIDRFIGSGKTSANLVAV